MVNYLHNLRFGVALLLLKYRNNNIQNLIKKILQLFLFMKSSWQKYLFLIHMKEKIVEEGEKRVEH